LIVPTRKDEGQATLELALCLPILLLFVAVLIQVGVIVSDQVRLWNAAREAARSAAVDEDPESIRRAAEGTGLHPLSIDVSPAGTERVQGEPVTVRLQYEAGRRLPLVGGLIPNPPLSASATMRIEDP
jgi:hypothetical protein